jgi:ABC-2 type transport system ATP-binding protein
VRLSAGRAKIGGMTNVIETRGLVKNYGELTAVDHVDLTVPEGTFFGLLGPNGAGKTTTLELIEGIRQPDAGEIRVLGEPVWPRNRSLLPRIGVQLQASAFFERLTVEEQLRCFADLYAVNTSRVEEMIRLVGLEEKRKTRTEDLSGGQAQRLSIACSLIHDPAIVFLDEPTAALDPQARRNLWDVLRAINDEGRTVVLTTHYMDEAEILCDQVGIIDHGRILTVDTPRNLITGLGAAYRIVVSEGAIGVEEARGIPGVEAASLEEGSLSLSTHDPAPALTALAERNALQGLQVTGATLEDVFLTLTGREYRA